MQNAETVLGVLRERGRRGLPCVEYQRLFAFTCTCTEHHWSRADLRAHYPALLDGMLRRRHIELYAAGDLHVWRAK